MDGLELTVYLMLANQLLNSWRIYVLERDSIWLVREVGRLV